MKPLVRHRGLGNLLLASTLLSLLAAGAYVLNLTQSTGYQDPEGGGAELAVSVESLAGQHDEVIRKYFDQAAVMLHAGQHEYAVKALHELLRLAPEMPEAHSNMGYAMLGKGEAKVAGDFFQVALELNPQLLNAYYGLALAFADQQQWPLAIGAMESYRHLQKTPDQFDAQAVTFLQQWRKRMAEEERS